VVICAGWCRATSAGIMAAGSPTKSPAEHARQSTAARGAGRLARSMCRRHPAHPPGGGSPARPRCRLYLIADQRPCDSGGDDHDVSSGSETLPAGQRRRRGNRRGSTSLRPDDEAEEDRVPDTSGLDSKSSATVASTDIQVSVIEDTRYRLSVW